MNIEGKSAIVTGGGSGLGAGTARALAARGAKVAVLDINMANAEAVAAEFGGLALHCNVSDAASGEAAVAAAAAAHGPAGRVWLGRLGPAHCAALLHPRTQSGQQLEVLAPHTVGARQGGKPVPVHAA